MLIAVAESHWRAAQIQTAPSDVRAAQVPRARASATGGIMLRHLLPTRNNCPRNQIQKKGLQSFASPFFLRAQQCSSRIPHLSRRGLDGLDSEAFAFLAVDPRDAGDVNDLIARLQHGTSGIQGYR